MGSRHTLKAHKLKKMAAVESIYVSQGLRWISDVCLQIVSSRSSSLRQVYLCLLWDEFFFFQRIAICVLERFAHNFVIRLVYSCFISLGKVGQEV